MMDPGGEGEHYTCIIGSPRYMFRLVSLISRAPTPVTGLDLV